MNVTRVVFCEQNLSVPEDTRVWREALTLTRAGYDVTVICPRTSRSRFREESDGIHIRRYPIPDLHRAPGLVSEIAETAISLICTFALTVSRLRHGPIAVLHAANPTDVFFAIGLLLRPLGTRFVFDQHDLVPELLEARTGRGDRTMNRFLGLLERCSYRCADLVIVPNNSYRRVAIERGRCNPARVITIRSGPDQVDAPDQTVARPSDPPMIMFAGVMGRQDGLDTLIDAIALLATDADRTFAVELIGSGTEVERLHHKATRLGIAERITWTGWLDQETLRSRLRSATIAVSPDDDTAFNRQSTMTKIAEYLALGLPTVVADLPENRTTAGEAAVFYAPNDVADLAKRIDELLTDATLRDDLRSRARRRASALTWKHSGERLVATYRHLLGAAPPPASDQTIEETS